MKSLVNSNTNWKNKWQGIKIPYHSLRENTHLEMLENIRFQGAK